MGPTPRHGLLASRGLALACVIGEECKRCDFQVRIGGEGGMLTFLHLPVAVRGARSKLLLSSTPI